MSRLAAKPGRTARPGVQINYVKLRTLRRGQSAPATLRSWLPLRSWHGCLTDRNQIYLSDRTTWSTPTPCPRKVAQISLKSPRRLWVRTYCASISASRIESDISTPLTCANPVIPGRILRTPNRRRASTSSIWDGRQGRGPTRLISPISTFQSCGSSSILKRRRRSPSAVTADACTSCVGRIAVPEYIVRNL